MPENSLISKMADGQMKMGLMGCIGKKMQVTRTGSYFSSYISQGMKNNNTGLAELPQPKANLKNPYECSNDSYERYQYKSNQIDEVRSNPLMKKLEASSGELDDFEGNVLKTVEEELEVSEEEVLDAMQVLGITVYDLLNPQNLAKLTVELTDVADASMLLLDADFQSLLSGITELGNDLMDKLALDVNQMQDFVSMMETLDQPEVLDQPIMPEHEENLGVLADAGGINVSDDNGTRSDKTIPVEILDAGNSDTNQKIGDNVTESVNGILKENEKLTGSENELQGKGSEDIEEQDVQVQNIREEDATEQNTQGEDTSNQDESGQDNRSEVSLSERSRGKSGAEKNTFAVEHANVQSVSQGDMPVNAAGNLQGVNEPYVSVDTVRIIEQLAEMVRVNHFSDNTSIEMFLNPENLGKLYVNISSKEGNVSAQIAATNEVVKEALEAQVFELKETLNQAGVKVDAIEVTVASHEFERNLEQGQSREEQEGQRQEEFVSKNRRNLDISMMDELSGLMSEEEALIAQIMRDNGNSFDYSA